MNTLRIQSLKMSISVETQTKADKVSWTCFHVFQTQAEMIQPSHTHIPYMNANHNNTCNDTWVAPVFWSSMTGILCCMGLYCPRMDNYGTLCWGFLCSLEANHQMVQNWLKSTYDMTHHLPNDLQLQIKPYYPLQKWYNGWLLIKKKYEVAMVSQGSDFCLFLSLHWPYFNWNKLFVKNSPQDQHASYRLNPSDLPRSINVPLKNTLPVVTAINRKQLIKIYERKPSAGHSNCPPIGGWRGSKRLLENQYFPIKWHLLPREIVMSSHVVFLRWLFKCISCLKIVIIPF